MTASIMGFVDVVVCTLSHVDGSIFATRIVALMCVGVPCCAGLVRKLSWTAFSLTPRGVAMLYYALIFLVVALIAGILGFTGIAGASVGIAKILFFVFVVLFVVSLIFNGRRSS
jgi:uncharacterized membrane protein YtjA (UPF0391 family)